MTHLAVVPLANRSVIETLEDTLERARKGEVAHVAVAYVVREGGAIGHIWSQGRGFGPLLGSIYYMASAFATQESAEA